MGTRTRQLARTTLKPRKRKSKALLAPLCKRWLQLLVGRQEACLVECHPEGCPVECPLVDSPVLVECLADSPVRRRLVLLLVEVTQLMWMMVPTSRKLINE